MKMSISTAIEERTDGDDETSQESQAKDESDIENDNQPEAQNGGSVSPTVHEITSDDDDDEEDEGLSNDNDESSNSSSNDTNSETPHLGENSNKQKPYDDEDMENGDEESDVEEVSMEDPLVQNHNKNQPIVISDTRSLADLASKQPRGNDKEPTVVIIDTNSLLSGKVPATQQPKLPTPSNLNTTPQNLCQSIAARGTTITPVNVKSNSVQNVSQSNPQSPQLPILPSLTDDMFVVEAPSFIVPYVYEKPSMKPFREFVDALGKELDVIRLKEEEEKAAKEKEEKEKKQREKQEKREQEDKDLEEELEEDDKEDKDGPEETKKSDKKDRKRKPDDDDASWDGESSSDTDDASDKDAVLKEKADMNDFNMKDLSGNRIVAGKSDSYFDCTLGQFFMNIGVNLVQEYVQNDLLKQQNRKLYKQKKSGLSSTKATEMAITSLSQNLKFSRKINAPYTLQQKKCEFCSFKTESMLAMAHHLEAPHMKMNIYKCNSCEFEIRSPHDILFHMEAMHNIRGRLERAPAYQQCANCTFEDNSKSKLARHLIACAKKYRPELNLAPPLDWEPPAKIPKIARARNNAMAPYPHNMTRAPMVNNLGRPVNIGMMPGMAVGSRPRGRPPMSVNPRGAPMPGAPLVRGGLMIMHNSQVNNYPIQNNMAGVNATPKISITPLPRTPQAQQAQANPAKGTFVICEICDGYIKDLEQLRNHMQWIHKVKIHPKMIYTRPPLNCQKCQFRFFTDQGLERHLLGSHGLVTSSMQEAANKGKDAGRCPVCGRVYQWKLLNHVARDHNMTLKPAHLSYKCTVCTATFGMYKQFENHVYSAHSVVAKRVMDKSKPAAPATKPQDGDLLKPIRINDEITIIPQPAKPLAATSSKDK